jgi:4-hydroxybenzoyl-CoA reductase subunit beta
MQLPQFEYLKPATLSEGLAMLAEHRADVKILSGGSDLLINMKFGLDTPRYLVSFNGLEELAAIKERPDGGLRIGAACTLTDLVRDPTIGTQFPALRDAVHSVGSRHIRNVGTLGGNLCLDTRCWYTNQSENWRATRDGCFKTDQELCHVIKTSTRCHALNTSDTAPMLMALDATVELSSAAGTREVPLLEFYREDGVHHTVREPEELLTAVLVPRFDGRAVFSKLAQREGLDFAAGTLAVAVTGTNEAPRSVRLVMGSIAAAPKVLAGCEAILLEQGLNDASIDAAASAARDALGKVTNLFTPSGYKRRLIKNFVREALAELRDQAD